MTDSDITDLKVATGVLHNRMKNIENAQQDLKDEQKALRQETKEAHDRFQTSLNNIEKNVSQRKGATGVIVVILTTLGGTIGAFVLRLIERGGN